MGMIEKGEQKERVSLKQSTRPALIRLLLALRETVCKREYV